MKTARLRLYVEYDETQTDAESVAEALDQLLGTAVSTPGVLDAVGNPDVGEFLVDDADSHSEGGGRAK